MFRLVVVRRRRAARRHRAHRVGVARAVLAAAVAAGCAVTLSSGPAHAAAVSFSWQLDEPAGAKVMLDANGGLNGAVGSAVQTGVRRDGAVGYVFSGPPLQPNPERLVQVPAPEVDDNRLDPGPGTFSATVRFRTTDLNPNLVQKGQSGTAGGFWKLELHAGWPTCLFRGAAKDVNGQSIFLQKAVSFRDDPRPQTKVNSGTWRTVRCDRTASSVTITLDPNGAAPLSKRIDGPSGDVNNSRPMVIGGKSVCDGAAVGCDYLAGSIDRLAVSKS